MAVGAIDPGNISVGEMERFVARFDALRGSEEAFVDSKLPGSRRYKINLIGMGVVERDDLPDLRPNIPLPASGFNLGMIQAEHGCGASLHAHETEEVFMPLIGPWAVFLAGRGRAERDHPPAFRLHPRAGRRVPRLPLRGRGAGTLLTLIGGPDAGKVAWDPEVLAQAAQMGVTRDTAGQVRAAATSD
jgi:hypothetical protein